MPKANPKLDRRGAQARVAKALLAADPFTRSDLDDQGTYAELRPNAEVIRVLKLISSGDQSAQMAQSMNTIMPLMMGWLALTFASGLSVYFVTSNLVSIAQYAAMGKLNWRNIIPTRRASASK